MRKTVWCVIYVMLVMVLLNCLMVNASKSGLIRLCPAGGKSFAMAWGLACEMKKRRKRYSTGSDENESKHSLLSNLLGKKQKRETRPATLTEIMKICCDLGCEIRDLLPYCDPFGSWNSK